MICFALPRHQRVDALRAVHLGAVAAPRIDMSHNLCAILAVGIEIGIEDAGATAELQLAPLHLDNIKAWWTEHADQRSHVLAHNGVEPLRG